MSFQIGNKIVGGKNVFVIAEIGQNHQGDIEIAKQMILEAKVAGADCVKFQKSCLKKKFTKYALNRPYCGPNSWGLTYGKHKEHLEFSIEQYKILQQFATEHDIIFTASAMDIQSLEDLEDLRVPVIKIGSGDANNVKLLEKAAIIRTPLIISTGMQEEAMIRRIVDIMYKNSKTNYCLLHCVSSYPTPPQYVGLRLLDAYRKLFPTICLGYSGHEEGIAISAAAVVFGAKIIERHFTLDKQQKGTDHKLSLEPAEMKRLIMLIRCLESDMPTQGNEDQKVLEFLSRYLNNTELFDVKMAMASNESKQILDCELSCRLKLGKSLVYQKDLKCGEKLCRDDISVKVTEPFGISAEYLDEMVGKTLVENVFEDENVERAHFY